MRLVLRHAAGGETRVPEVAEKIADELGLSIAERDELLPSGRQRVLHNRIHWSKFYLSKAGLIVFPARGHFVATDAGRALLAHPPERIDTRILETYPAFRAWYQKQAAPEIEGSAVSVEPGLPIAVAQATPEEQIEAAHRALHAALRAELLERIRDNSPAFFEGLIVDLLVAMGYGGGHKKAAEQLGRSGDGGVDGVISEDRLGLNRIYVQAKRYAEGNSIQRPDVDFH